jgi:hypothetical protein
MKNFRDYLIESDKTYSYRIKILGDISEDFMRGLKEKLVQFDPVKISAPKKTPILKSHTDFPGMENERVTIIDVEFRYPAIHPQITSMAQMLGLDPNRLVMHTIGYDDSLGEELEAIQDQNQNLLTDTEFPADNEEQKKLSKDYAADPYDHEVLQNSYRSRFEVAGGKTEPAETTNSLPMGKDSPIGGRNKLPSVESNAR